MTFTLVDTDILIDLAAEKDQAVSCVQQLEQRSSLCLSSITEMELIVGCRNKTELRNTDRLLERFTTISVNEQVSAIDYEFITKNQRDYRFIDGLKLLPYPPE
jgi:predicted nucleic acid-binding protein